MKIKTIITSVISVLLLCFYTAAFAEAISNSIQMSFEECLSRKESVIAQLGVNPENIIPIVNTSTATVTRICTADGSVLISCSKKDRKMVLTRSSKFCN